MFNLIDEIITEETGVVIEHRNVVEDYLNSKTHKVLSFLGKRFSFFKGMDNGHLTALQYAGAMADVEENKVIVNNQINIYDHNVYEALLKHEVGHILDFKNRGKLRFYIDALICAPKKPKLLKARDLKAYYALSIEAKANAYYGLQYIDFYEKKAPTKAPSWKIKDIKVEGDK